MILKDIWLDVKAVQERDPAARSALEVLLLYQGVHALIWHRFAHWFYKHHMFFIARLISQIARFIQVRSWGMAFSLIMAAVLSSVKLLSLAITVLFIRALPWAEWV